MPRYHVVAREIIIWEAFIDADDDADAEEIGHEMESQEFDHVEGDWEVVGIQAIPEPPPPKADPKENQLSLF